MKPENARHWKALSRLASAGSDEDAAQEPVPLALEAAGLHADLSKQRLTPEVLEHLLGLAEEVGLAEATRAQFQGEAINRSELSNLNSSPDNAVKMPSNSTSFAHPACYFISRNGR